MLFVLLSSSVAQPQSEAVELSPGGAHLRGLTAACIISPFTWILIGPDQRAGGGGVLEVGWWVTLQLETGFYSKMHIRNESKGEMGGWERGTSIGGEHPFSLSLSVKTSHSIRQTGVKP